MKGLLKLTLIEMKLFIREPMTMIFTFALPLLLLFVMGGVFGNVANDFSEFRGLSAMSYYTPAYIALVLVSIGIVGIPGHLTGYRERGVLRRFQASSLSGWRVFGAQGLVSLITASIGGIIVLAAAYFTYDVKLPDNLPIAAAAFLVSALSFAALGILLGAILPNSRAAQGAGLVLFFLMLVLGGAGPPRAVMTEAMQTVGDLMPLKHAVTLLQEAWLGIGWNWVAFGVMATILICSLTAAVLLIRKNS
jgi:ABC-2 type transport system permease protein